MLDTLDDDAMRVAIRRIDGRARVEISGGVTVDRMPALAALGADCVSIGALTHSAPAADISFEMESDQLQGKDREP
jgi:nicotinate-nucleotide pyrophosphorylase (carboxylating)